MPNSSNPSLREFTYRRLSATSKLKPFDCDDDDLNDFFHNDSSNYAMELMSITYTFENKKQTVAFFSVLNDKIINKDSRKRQVSKEIPYTKRRKTYPAVKVGRLAVHKEFCRMGIGGGILNFIKHFFTSANKTGCRFITVDAYNQSGIINFYKKHGFKFLTTEDEKEETRLMYFDLILFQL